MAFYATDRIALFIDGANLYSAAKGLNIDLDFKKLLEEFQKRGVRVTVVSTNKSQPPMASDELRRQADAYVDLADLASIIARPRTSSMPRFLQPAEDDDR